MRIAVVSDIHGNFTALEAVMADLRDAAPDLVVQGGDLVAGGARPAEVIDLVRELKWPGVYGNGEEMLWKPGRASQQLADPQFRRIRELVLNEVRPETIRAIGEERLAWLRALPLRWSGEDLTVVHAAPDDAWNSPPVNATDEELERAYGRLGTRSVVYDVEREIKQLFDVGYPHAGWFAGILREAAPLPMPADA